MQFFLFPIDSYYPPCTNHQTPTSRSFCKMLRNNDLYNRTISSKQVWLCKFFCIRDTVSGFFTRHTVQTHFILVGLWPALKHLLIITKPEADYWRRFHYRLLLSRFAGLVLTLSIPSQNLTLSQNISFVVHGENI